MDNNLLEEKVKDLFNNNYDAVAELYNIKTEEFEDKAVMTEEQFIKVVSKFVLDFCSKYINDQYQKINNHG